MGSSAPVRQCAQQKKLDKLRSIITREPHAAQLTADVETQILDSLLTQGEQRTNRLFDSIDQSLTRKADCEPDDGEVRAKTGIYLTRRTGHFTYLSICLRNADAEIFYSHFALSDNPRTNAGNRRALADDARGTHAPASSSAVGDLWTAPRDDSCSMPRDSEAPRIPEWAVAPGTPLEERPVSGYTDLGTSVPRHGYEPPAPAGGTNAPDKQPGGDDQNLQDLQTRFNSAEPGADGLTPPMRHLQTLLNIMQSAGGPDAPGKTGLPRSTVVVYCQLTTLLGLAKDAGVTQHGVRLSPADLRRRLCNAEVLPMVLDSESQILDLGRTERYFPEYMRQAILARDGGCLVPGCTVPPEHCEIHHLKPWSEGGLTRIEDGTPVCGSHHHAAHADQIRIVDDGGLPAVIQPEYVDPEQRPRRNTFWGQQTQIQTPLF